MKSSTLCMAAMMGAAVVSTAALADDNYQSRQHDERYKTLKHKAPDYAHYDYAKVMSVDPVVKIVKIPTQRRVCRGDHAGHYDRRAGVSGGIFAPDKQYASKSHDQRCWVVEDYHEKERVEGYWVTYRYEGHEYVAWMDHDPGRRIRVKVTVEPVAG